MTRFSNIKLVFSEVYVICCIEFYDQMLHGLLGYFL